MNASTLTNRFSTTETHKIAQHTTDEIVRRFGFKPGWETTPHTVASALISAGWLPRGTQVVEGKWVGGWHRNSWFAWDREAARAEMNGTVVIDGDDAICTSGVSHWWFQAPDGRKVDLLRDQFRRIQSYGQGGEPWVYVTPQDSEYDYEAEDYSV